MDWPGGATEDSVLPVRVRFTPGSIIRAVLIVMAFVVVAQVVGAAADPLVWFAEGVAGAAIFYPVVVLLSRRMPHWVAVALVSLGVVAFVAFLGLRLFTELKGEAEEFQQRAPTIAENVDSSSAAMLQFGMGDKIIRLSEDVAGGFRFDGADVSTLSTAASIGSSLFVVWLFAVMMLFSAPAFLAGAGRQISDGRRKERLEGVLAAAYVNSWEYLALCTGRALAYGAMTWFVAWLVGIPSPTLLSVWVALWAFVPRFGLVIGGSMVALVAMFESFPVAGIVFAAYIVASVVDATTVQRRIEDHTVHVGSALTMVAAMVGFGLFGFGGTIVFCVVLFFGLAILDQIRPEPTAPDTGESASGALPSPLTTLLASAGDPASG